MIPIYQTIGGELQCVMHEGTLMVREWPDGRPSSEFGQNPNPWTASDQTEEYLRKLYEAPTTERGRSRYGCMLHCLTGVRPSGWRMKPKSEKLGEEIETLMAKREAALLAEIADRPAASPSLFADGGAA